MPTGQVLRWHFLIMVQPSTMSGAVLKPNSSAPSNAPTTTSLPTHNKHYCNYFEVKQKPSHDIHRTKITSIILRSNKNHVTTYTKQKIKLGSF
jgi:hypothetical protein